MGCARDPYSGRDQVLSAEVEEPTAYSLAILKALQRKQMYLGTVPAAEVRKRRIKGRVAKAARKANRS
jgi:hypothetical protein